MAKTTPILLLGVAGLGLSLAMFFDTKNKPIPRRVEAEETPEENEEMTEVIDVVSMTDEEEEEMRQEIKDELKSEMRRDYKELYRKKKRKEEAPRIIADYRYKGDGSHFDKKMYFMREAYRRSREQVPIDQNIALAVKLSSELDEIEKSGNFDDVILSDIEEEENPQEESLAPEA